MNNKFQKSIDYSNQPTAEESRRITARMLLQSTGYIDSAKVHAVKGVNFKLSGRMESRATARANERYRRIVKAKGKEPNEFPKGYRCDHRVANMGAARTHYENIGLGMLLRSPEVHAFRNRYRGGSWNKQLGG